MNSKMSKYHSMGNWINSGIGVNQQKVILSRVPVALYFCTNQKLLKAGAESCIYASDLATNMDLKMVLILRNTFFQ